MTKKLYTERRFMRALEKGWISVEGVVNRFAKSDFNPFHHLGTLTIFMLVVLIATGVYLTLFYRPVRRWLMIRWRRSAPHGTVR